MSAGSSNLSSCVRTTIAVWWSGATSAIASSGHFGMSWSAEGIRSGGDADLCFRIAVVLGEVPFGVLVDRVGRRPAYLCLAALTVVTYVGIAGVTSTPELFAVWLLWAAQWALASGLGPAYLFEAVRHHAPGVPVVEAFSVVRLATGITGVAPGPQSARAC